MRTKPSMEWYIARGVMLGCLAGGLAIRNWVEAGVCAGAWFVGVCILRAVAVETEGGAPT